MRKVTIHQDYYYHVYNRGVNHNNIFFHRRNWLFFLRRLGYYFKPELADVVAYCLMPNHYHLLVHVHSDKFAQQVMHPFGISYAKAINKEQSREGRLFQGPFQAKLVDSNDYLLHLTRYIHFNPVEAGFVVSPEEWEFSSYKDYIGLRQGKLPKPESLGNDFLKGDEYVRFCLEDSMVVPNRLLFD